LALCGWPLVWLLERNTGHVILPFVIVVLYLSAFRGRICSVVLSNRVITDIGGMCYSIYLFHFLVIYAVKHFTAPIHIGQGFWAYYTIQATMIFPVLLLLCGAFFLLIERPCMDREWPRKLWKFGQDLVLPTTNEQPAQKPG
jgi:peptidoglycan/LPS O-acetylase OafA/YrhL